MIKSIKDAAMLSNGVRMPWLGLGVFMVEDGPSVVNTVKYALDSKYRSIDTAAIYGNENGVGQAIQEIDIPREEIFITSKVWNDEQRNDNVRQAFEQSLERLNLEYIDLYLVHWPVPGKYISTWKILEQLYKEKRVRAIGVSNFLQSHLLELLKTAEIVPMVNQIEFHPFLAQPDLLEMCRENNIQLEAWSPLMKGKCFTDPVIEELAEKHQRTPAQIVLRWDLQHEVITIPKSSRPERIKENANIFDFELSAMDMKKIDDLDSGKRIGADPDNFHF